MPTISVMLVRLNRRKCSRRLATSLGSAWPYKVDSQVSEGEIALIEVRLGSVPASGNSDLASQYRT
jgi:hypothetical protein